MTGMSGAIIALYTDRITAAPPAAVAPDGAGESYQSSTTFPDWPERMTSKPFW